jgi:hypothetical protein
MTMSEPRRLFSVWVTTTGNERVLLRQRAVIHAYAVMVVAADAAMAEDAALDEILRRYAPMPGRSSFKADVSAIVGTADRSLADRTILAVERIDHAQAAA